MWETQLKIVYQEYKMSSEREAALIEQVHRLLDNLIPTALGELPGTRVSIMSRSLLGGREHQITHANVDIELNSFNTRENKA